MKDTVPAPDKYVGDPPMIACNMCGQVTNNHKEWCNGISDKIYRRFNSTFREVYNVIEIALDKEKAEKVKDLIGNTLMETRNDCTRYVSMYFKKEL